MKKILLICSIFFNVFITGCSNEPINKPVGIAEERYAGILDPNRNNIGEPRIQVVYRTGYAGASIIIFLDTKTGREFMYYDNSMVEIKPKEEK